MLAWPAEVVLHSVALPRRDAIAMKIGAELTAFIAAALHGCLEAQVVEQLSLVLARNQPDETVGVETVQAVPLLLGEL